MRIDSDVLAVLGGALSEGTALRLPGQLDRDLYVKVAKVIEAAGGKWNRKAQAHLFRGDAAPVIAGLLADGAVVPERTEQQFFQTPPGIADHLIRTAGVEASHVVLEPSAGEGAIASRLAPLAAAVDCIELHEQHGAVIRAAGYARTLTVGDFLATGPQPIYDRVVMNPPFTGKQDIAHVQHARRFLKPGGLLVAVMMAGVRDRTDKVTSGFCRDVDDAGGRFDALPAGAFAKSGTNVNTIMAVIPAAALTEGESSTMTTTDQPITLESFDPADLVMDENVRTDAAATVTPVFTASIKATRGNAVPVLLMRLPDGRLRVWDGARRTIACQQANLKVNGIVAGADGDDQASEQARILQQLIVNDDREGLTVTDRAAGMLTLFEAGGMTTAQIAKATGRGKPEVEAALTVGRSEIAGKAADRWDLTLDQAAVLAEFGGDTEALTELARAAKNEPAQFDHVAQQLRDSAAERAQKAALTEVLEARGFKVTDNWQGPNRERWHNLRNWLAADGSDLTEDSHAECPYRAVRIEQELAWPAEAEAAWRADPANAEYLGQLREHDDLGPDDVVPVEFDDDESAVAAGWVTRWEVGQGYCTDAVAAGHKDRYRAGQLPGSSSRGKPEPGPEQAEQAKAERRRVLDGNKRWRSATEVRVAHLKGLLARKALTPKVLEQAAQLLTAEAITRGEAQPEKTGEGHALAARLLGLASPEPYAGGRDVILAALAAAAPARRQVIVLGMILAGTEGEDGTFGCCADVHTWQRAADGSSGRWYSGQESRPGRYLGWLNKHTGYPLSELEALVAHGKPAQETAPGSAGPSPDVAPPVAEIDTGDGSDAIDPAVENYGLGPAAAADDR